MNALPSCTNFWCISMPVAQPASISRLIPCHSSSASASSIFGPWRSSSTAARLAHAERARTYASSRGEFPVATARPSGASSASATMCDVRRLDAHAAVVHAASPLPLAARSPGEGGGRLATSAWLRSTASRICRWCREVGPLMAHGVDLGLSFGAVLFTRAVAVGGHDVAPPLPWAFNHR